MAKTKQFGFTLVELLTVIGIIALLIGVLVPVVQRVQLRAKEAAVQAQITNVSTGLDVFKGDFGYYPSSVPQIAAPQSGLNAAADRSNVGDSYRVQGFHRLAFALLGRDRQGCPGGRGTNTSPPFPYANSDPGPDSLTGFYYTQNSSAGSDQGTFSGVWRNTGGWSSVYKTARKGPYINSEGFTIVNDSTIGAFVPVICDKFGRSDDSITQAATDYTNVPKARSEILYFAANESGQWITPSATGTILNADLDKQIYYGADNWLVTDPALSKTGDNVTFRQFIDDPKATVVNDHIPHNRDRFLLISAGYDGKYFTGDDIVNWTK